MSAMLLLTLGVPKETIMRDYMASNYYRQKRIRKRANLGPLIGINPYTSLPLLEVRPIYLETAFRTIEEQYGSLDNYIREGLGISEAEQEKFRQEYLF
jgi:protein-tyrosine phosphatase